MSSIGGTFDVRYPKFSIPLLLGLGIGGASGLTSGYLAHKSKQDFEDSGMTKSILPGASAAVTALPAAATSTFGAYSKRPALVKSALIGIPILGAMTGYMLYKKKKESSQ
jgi:hypothetical protein